MRRFLRVFPLKGGNTAFRPLKALSLLFAFLLIFSSISVGRSAYAENAPLDKFPFVGAYAVYIARGVYQGFLKDFSKGLGLCIDSKGPTPELKKSHYISVEWRIIDFKDPYWVVNFSISFINATVFVYNYSNENEFKIFNNVKITFKAVYLIDKHNASCYLLDTGEFLGYWPFWLTHDELNNINLIKRRIPPKFRNYPLNITTYHPQIAFLQTKGAGYYIFTNEKIVTYNSTIPPPIILLVTAYHEKKTGLWDIGDPAEIFYYETKYGLCVGIRYVRKDCMIFKNKTSTITGFWGFDDFRDEEIIKNFTKGALSSERLIFPGIVLYNTNVDVFSLGGSEGSLPKGPSALVVTLGVVIVSSVVALDVFVSKRRKV
ncbi:MAG: hypothetical protein DRN26_03900 [Thermoplasmata archaeon]|nr:MAG: hypothetical protein DRN26_03900 [Thermoplasmata archaeon]